MEKINKEDKKHLHKTMESFNSTVSFEQVWNKHSYKKRKNKKSYIRPKLSFIIGAAIFLFVIVPVSAAIVPFEWNGMKVTITNTDDNPENASIEKELLSGPTPTYKELVENYTTNKNDILKQTLSLKEAQNEFPFPILRPEDKLTPTISIGTIKDVIVLGDDAKEKVSGDRLSFHDFYENGNKWAIVTQSLDQGATDFLTGNIESMSSTFVGEWENVEMSDNKLAMFIEGDKLNVLNLFYKIDDNNIIMINVMGNRSKEELIKLADAYNINK